LFYFYLFLCRKSIIFVGARPKRPLSRGLDFLVS
jgi:hypothetical protein